MCDGWGNAFLVHLAAAVDIPLQPSIEIAVCAAFGDPMFVVKLYFGNQKTGESLCV
jgi:hypothetical protein